VTLLPTLAGDDDPGRLAPPPFFAPPFFWSFLSGGGGKESHFVFTISKTRASAQAAARSMGVCPTAVHSGLMDTVK